MLRCDIAVVGAGMVGASAALAMARKGFEVVLIEQQALSREKIELPEQLDLRVSAISPSSQQLLDELGVWQDISQQRSCDYHQMYVWHENGKASMHFASEQMGISHLGTIVENKLIQSYLIQRLSSLSNVQILDQQQVQAVSQDAKAVSVKISESNDIEAQLLFAADGRASAVRKLLQMPSFGGDYQQSAIVANVATEKPHQHTAWQRFLVTGPLAFLPLSNGQSSIVWSADTHRAEELMALDDDAFMQALSEAFEYRLGEIITTSRRAMFPLGWHSAESWLQQRVVLIGDAAHGVHPLAGQGVNLGFADVTRLNQLLQRGERLFNYPLLRRFERERKAESVSAMHLFSALKQIYGQDNALLCLARDIGMSFVDSNTLVKRLIMGSALQNMS